MMIGNVYRASQSIFVNREDPKNKGETILEIKKRSNPNNDWPQILFFPEGTVENRNALLTFKPGNTNFLK